jgi:outer membrane protein assembly factor BamB
LVCGTLSSAAAATPQENAVRSFSIHDTRSSAAAWDAAEEHIAAARWSEALESLQGLIEEHRGAVLAATAQAGGSSEPALYRGAPRRAAARLATLPRVARELYEKRFGAAARRALKEARARGQRGALAEVARRWPISGAAEEALWSLGDMEWEQGHHLAARRAWGRAVVRGNGGAPGTVPGAAQHGRDSRDSGDNRQPDAGDAWEEALERYGRHSPERAVGARRRLGAGSATQMAAADSAAQRSDGTSASPEAGNTGDAGSTFDVKGPGDVRGPGRSSRERAMGSFRLAGSRDGLVEGADPAPRRESGGWTEPFVLPAHPFKTAAGGQLYPVLAGDTLLVSTSLQLIAVDALSGRRRWDGGLVPGWDALSGERIKEFFDGIDQKTAVIAPAVGSGVALAALQIPVSAVRKSTYGDSDIVRVLPDRRLFAYDLTSGAPLWDHRPPPLWDGEGGSFTERMRVCGSPVIAAGRVLVPMCRYQGRIDFHLACFDLWSGERLWSVPLITGQRELNMFGRPTQEFSAPPVRVEGDVVCVLTQLGSLAAVDLFSGELLWEFLYDQMPLPQTHGWTPVWRREVWLNAPPVCADGVLLATPADSRELLALDLVSGQPLWSLDHGALEAMTWAGNDSSSRRQGLDVLLGADHDSVYLGGHLVAALAAPRGGAGLAAGPPTAARWVVDADGGNRGRPRALLARETVLIPSYDRRLEVDRQSGRRRDHPTSWNSPPGGNVLLSGGALYHLTSKQLSASFEWSTLLSRAEGTWEANPASVSAARDLAALYLVRGRSLWHAGNATDADSYLERARNTLAPLARSEDSVVDSGLLGDLQIILRSCARMRSELGDRAAALALLTRAAALATAPALLAESPELLRDTLVELLLLDDGTEQAVELALLDELERRVPLLSLTCFLPPVDSAPGQVAAPWDLRPRPGELGLAALGSSRDGAASDADARSAGGTGEELPTFEVEVAAWARLARARLALERRDWGPHLADLHSLIADHGQLAPGPRGTPTIADWAAERIGLVLPLGAEDAHQLYQRRAADALAEARASHQRQALTDLRQLYPHTTAAEDAQRDLFTWALESGDPRLAAATILGGLPSDFSPASPSALQLDQFRALARMLGDLGNGVLRDAWIGAQEGRRLTSTEVPPVPSSGTLGPELSTLKSQGGSWEDLGPVFPDGGRLMANRSKLVLWSSSGEEVWQVDYGRGELPASWTGRLASAHGRLYLATTKRLVAIDAANAEQLWDVEPDGYVSGLALASGILVCGLREQTGTARLLAFDAHGGLPLWERQLPASGFASEPLAGARQVLVLPRNPGQTAMSLDLFTGGLLAHLQIGPVLGSSRAAAWIEGQRLFLPNFLESSRPERNHIRAFDLNSGELAWEQRFGDDGSGRELHAVLSYGDQHFLLLRSRGRSSKNTTGGRAARGAAGLADTPPGLLLQLDTGIGATARVGRLEIAEDEQPVGVGKARRIQLAAPYLFLRSSPAGRAQLRLRAVHLPHGVRWTSNMPLRLGELYTRSMPEPALFDNAVAFSWTEWPRQSLRPRAHTFLALLERSTGRALAQRELSEGQGTSEYLDLIPNGGWLLLRGRDALELIR